MSGSWASSSTSASCSVSEASSKVPPQALDALDLGICALNQLFSHRVGLHTSSTRHRGGAIVSKSKVGRRKAEGRIPNCRLQIASLPPSHPRRLDPTSGWPYGRPSSFVASLLRTPFASRRFHRLGSRRLAATPSAMATFRCRRCVATSEDGCACAVHAGAAQMAQPTMSKVARPHGGQRSARVRRVARAPQLMLS
jgi:hypothetical protein